MATHTAHLEARITELEDKVEQASGLYGRDRALQARWLHGFADMLGEQNDKPRLLEDELCEMRST